MAYTKRQRQKIAIAAMCDKIAATAGQKSYIAQTLRRQVRRVEMKKSKRSGG